MKDLILCIVIIVTALTGAGMGMFGCNEPTPPPLIKHKWFVDYEYASGERDTVNHVYLSERENVRLELTGNQCVAVVSGLYVENIACYVRRFKVVVYNKEYVR